MKRLACSSTSPCVEVLEARTLFSLYSYQSLIDQLGLANPVHDLAPPGGAAQGFGAAVAGLGDIDGDGYADFAVGAPGTDAGSPVDVAGRVFIYSGHDAHLIRTLTDHTGGFGVSLANVGDVNNDGVPDLLVGSPWLDATDDNASDPTGGAYIYSGADGALVRILSGDSANGEFGRVVVSALDINYDGVPEVVIGAPGAGDNGAGRVYVYSGSDGGLLHTLNGATAGERFGAAIAPAPADALTESRAAYLVVGAPNGGDDERGRVAVFDENWHTSYTLVGSNAGDRFGTSVAIGYYRPGPYEAPHPVHYLLVGVPGFDINQGPPGGTLNNTGAVRIYYLSSGQSGNTITPADGEGTQLGTGLAALGDINGDGSTDFAAFSGAGESRGVVHILTGMYGWQQYSEPPIGFHVEEVPFLVGAAAPLGDINGDGFPDIVTGNGADRVTVLSALSLGDPIRFEGASPNGEYLWSDRSSRQFVFMNGRAVAYSQISGLTPRVPGADPSVAFSTIRAILNDGTIVFTNGASTNFGTLPGEVFVIVNGGSVTLESLVTSVEGGETPAYDRMIVVKTGGGGHLMLTDDASRVWTYYNGVLAYVWTGFGRDINSSGVVVGLLQLPDTSYHAAIRIPGSEPILLEGLGDAGAIRDDNVVAGWLAGTATFVNPGHLATWANGVVNDLAPGPNVNTSTQEAHWVFRGFDNDGRILADVVTNQYRSPDTYTLYLYDTDDGLRPLQDSGVGAPEGWVAAITPFPDDRVPVARIVPNGTIQAFDAALTAIPPDANFMFREGSPTATLSSVVGQFIAGINEFNGLEVFLNVGSTGWVARRLGDTIQDVEHASVALYMDRDPTNIYVALAADGEVRIFALLPMAPGRPTELELSAAPGRTPIVRGMTAFTNEQGVVHLAGIDANDDVVIYYRQPQFSSLSTSGWSYNNLTDDHLQPQGLTLPSLVGSLTAFATTWSGMNINGLDAEGHVHTIWWAPGMTLWYTNDLTAETGTEALHGRLTSYSTPWGTLHMTGLNEEGDVATLWWAAGFGADWRVDVLAPGGTPLAADSLTSYVTPWGGLNIAGRDAGTGRAVVYWWSPESNRWQAETLSLRDGVESPELRGALSASVSPDGIMAISAADTEGNVQRFSWQPGDSNLWRLENITEIVSG